MLTTPSTLSSSDVRDTLPPLLHHRFQDPPFRIRTLFEIARGTFFSVLLFAAIMMFNVIQISSVILRPFYIKGFRAINRFCANTWWGACVLIGRYCYNLQLRLTGDTLPYRENAILIANHQDVTDAYTIMILALTKGRLGDLKWFVKDIIKYIPGIGWGTLCLDCLFVKRNWEADKSKIEAVFSSYRKHKIPAWFITFVEGTRLTKEKLARSQKYAREKNLPILENVLLPRTKGFVATMQGISQEVTAVYDFTIGYPHGVVSIWQVLKGTSPDLHLHVKRYDIKSLPANDDVAGLSKWLMDRFVEKDRRLAELKRQGFFSPN